MGGDTPKRLSKPDPVTSSPNGPAVLLNFWGGAVISHKFHFSIFAIVLFLSCALTARGQSTFGSISGTVKDASGAAIPDAQVTLTSIATGAKETFTTDQNGLYSFVNVNPGEYTI